MPRGRSKLTWIKLHCYQRLHGKLNWDFSEAEQSVWDKLLCLAGLCNEVDGIIADSDGKAYTHRFVAHELNSSLELLETTVKKCLKDGRATEDENGIHITNWKRYQSDYDRQKPYRQRKKDEWLGGVSAGTGLDLNHLAPQGGKE